MTPPWNNRPADADAVWTERLREADPGVREARRPFDAGEGLRRLAAGAGLVPLAPAPRRPSPVPAAGST